MVLIGNLETRGIRGGVEKKMPPVEGRRECDSYITIM
jgi:hypothetical protein